MIQRMQRMFHIHGHTHARRLLAVAEARDAIAASGASILDIRNLSNKASVFHVMLKTNEWAALIHSLSCRGIVLHDVLASHPDDLPADADGDIQGTLQLSYLGEEPDLRDEIPAVPG